MGVGDHHQLCVNSGLLTRIPGNLSEAHAFKLIDIVYFGG
jgi:hypothetical protein